MSSGDPGAHGARHPSLKQYVVIAIFLFIITIVEFLIILPEGYRGAGWTIAPLAILSAIKFAAVIFFYMHLKFDKPMLTWIFLGGLALGFAVVFALVGLFSSFTPSPRAWAEANAEPCAFDHEHGGCLAVSTAPAAEPAAEPAATEGETPEPAAPAPAATTGGNALVAQGQAVFTGTGICMTCHTVEGVPGAVGMLGPDLTHIATDAANRKPGMDAQAYITESIKEPELFIAEGVDRATPGLMTAAIVASLSDADVEALVAFLMEQE